MSIEIMLVAKSVIDLEHFIEMMNFCMGESITLDLDRKNIEVKGNSGFLRLAEQFTWDVEQFAYYGFLIFGTRDFFFHLLQKTNLFVKETVRTDVYMGLCFKTLKEWKDIIVQCSTDDEPSHIREFANKVQTCLEQREGLYRVFNCYNKFSMKDNTYKLMEIK
jgi:hypothetical protein